MKIAFLLLDSGVGGGQRVATNVAELLIDRGHRLGLLVPGPGPLVERFRSLGAKDRFVDLTTLRRPFGLLRAAQMMRNYDLLYSHTSIPGQILSSLAAGLADCPHVAHQHTYPVFSSRPLIRRAQLVLYARSLARTRFIAVAEHVRDGLITKGVPPGHVDVIANGVSIPEERVSDEGFSRPLRVGMLGRFDPGKGMHTFIAAAKSAGQREDSLNFVICGYPGPFRPYEMRIREQAKEDGIQVVEATQDGPGFLRELDLVIIPSRYEGSPLVLLEAMALGKPIIASEIPGISETIENGHSGLLIPLDDSESLARAILSLSSDPVTRARLGNGARLRATKQYSLAQSLNRIIQVLENAVDRNG